MRDGRCCKLSTNGESREGRDCEFRHSQPMSLPKVPGGREESWLGLTEAKAARLLPDLTVPVTVLWLVLRLTMDSDSHLDMAANGFPPDGCMCAQRQMQ